jgi:hypothetical protein
MMGHQEVSMRAAPLSPGPIARRAAASLAIAALSACSGKGDTAVACDTSAVASVQVIVTDATANILNGATVTYSVDGGAAAACDAFNSQYVCGWEVAGEITVTAEVEGYAPGSQTVTVQKGECHVETENLTLRLDPAR